MARKPPRAKRNDRYEPNRGKDTAAYLVHPGQITMDEKGNIKVSPGHLFHARPYLTNGNSIFVFPTPTEGFRRSGQATIALHHYIGDNFVDAQVIHLDESRIEMSGTFPGTSSVENMHDFIVIATAPTPDLGLTLYVPGVFEVEQYVILENYEFDHPEDDQTHSISYRLTFVRTGVGRRIVDPSGTPAAETPIESVDAKPRGGPQRTFIVREGVRTLKAIANYVYGDVNQWYEIAQMNRDAVNAWQTTEFQNSELLPDLPLYRLPTYVWPLGTRFVY